MWGLMLQSRCCDLTAEQMATVGKTSWAENELKASCSSSCSFCSSFFSSSRYRLTFSPQMFGLKQTNCIHVCLYVCMYIYTYVRMYVCLFVEMQYTPLGISVVGLAISDLNINSIMSIGVGSVLAGWDCDLSCSFFIRRPANSGKKNRTPAICFSQISVCHERYFFWFFVLDIMFYIAVRFCCFCCFFYFCTRDFFLNNCVYILV